MPAEAAPPPLLLTPGPLTTDARVRAAMGRDWGSRDANFIALTAELRAGLLQLVNGAGAHAATPLQGSGTYAVEAAIGTLVRPADRLLVLVNGAYGRRMVEIAGRLGRPVEALTWAEDQAVDPEAVRGRLAAEPAITHVALVQVETTTGLLNPWRAVAQVVRAAGRVVMLDAMAGFAALPIDLATDPVDVVMCSSNKALEGAPGLGFVLTRRDLLDGAAGVAPSLALDLHAQEGGFRANGQWRFTPPVQVVAAAVEALRLLAAEGGPPARLARYSENLRVLVDGLEAQGFPLFLPHALQAPIIATFRPAPGRPWDFEGLYAGLQERGFVIYPGKLTAAPSFRIGCIGAVTPADMARLVAAVAEVAPAPAASPSAAEAA